MAKIPHTTFLAKIKTFIVVHKVWSACIAIAVVFVGYRVYKSKTSTSGQTMYVTAPAQKGTLVSSITGTGQVGTSNQVDLTSKASGNIISIAATNGEEVKAGTIIAEVDPHDAEVALENAKISLAKLTEPADAVSTLQAENAVTDAKQSEQKAYDDGFNTVVQSFIDLPDTLTGLQNTLFSPTTGYLYDTNVRAYGDAGLAYQAKAIASYNTALNSYNASVAIYKTLSRTSPNTSVEDIIERSYNTVKATTEALTDAKNAVDFIKSQKSENEQSSAATTVSNLTSWTSKMNGDLASLLADKNAIDESGRTIESANESLTKLQSGADPLDVESSQLALEQQEYNYENYFIKAPFDGIVAKVNVKKGDDVGSGTSVATFITTQQIVNVSLNEVDIAKVKTGQKATLTFDAVPDLTISGHVTDVDFLGTVSQGVVTYNVEITLDTTDPSVKSGMSVNAAIVTSVDQDVLLVPNSAVKLQGSQNYVEVFNPPLAGSESAKGAASPVLPTQVPVQIGASNDTSTEIVSGLSDGDQVVTRTISGTTVATGSTAPSLLGSIGGNRAGGAAAAGGGFRGGAAGSR